MTTYTLFSQVSPGTSVVADTTAYTLGIQFSVSAAATLTAIWFYSPSGAALPATIALYQVTGTSLVQSQAASWSGAGGSGWVRASFTAPSALTASTSYKACVFRTSGSNWYSSTASYWTSGAGGSGITNGPLTAPKNTSATPGQDSLHTSGTLTYPGSSGSGANYWIDPEVTTPGGLLIGSFP